MPKLAFVSWGFLLVAAGFFASAQPPTQLGFFARLSTRVVRSYWDRGDLGVALGCCGAAWGISLFAMIVHSRRVGRADDRVHLPTVIAGIAASIASFAFLAIVNTVYSNWEGVTGATSSVVGLERYVDQWVALAWAVAAIVV